MSLTAGTRLGPYEIVAPIGAGGMGEVYRARDTRLDRTVAVKIAAEQFSERFDREARAVAALNHPNICTLYDVGPNYLVMEFIDGPTLAERIGAGALSPAEALPIALQIADALAAAHDKGIVHRDLKPANVKLTGAEAPATVKVLDFGLAKAFESSTVSANPTVSPTLTLASTRAGVILGTAGYMSPEQARGLAADRRADIWAFGVVLFEMLTGRQIFSGETISDTLAAVLRADLQWNALPPDTAPAIRRLLRRCLERDRSKRLRDIADARLEIEEALSAPAEAPAAAPAPRSKPSLLPWAIAALAVISTAWLAVTHWRGQAVEPSYQAHLLPPEKTAFTPPGAANGGFAVSPDGRSLAFAAMMDGKSMLWVRRLDSLAARPLPGTENPSFPFWSPDNRFVGFFAENKLKKIEVAGGPPQVICDAGQGRGGTWNRDGLIVFSAINRGLHRVPAAGGQPAQLSTFENPEQENAHYWPSFLPDGRHFLYQARNTNRDKSAICVGSVDGKPSRRVELLKNRFNAIYANGWLLFLRQTTLFAQRLDPERLKLEGDAVPVAEHVGYGASMALGSYSASATGALVYGNDWQQDNRLMWAARDGKLSPVAVEPGYYADPALSPDATRLAVTHELAGNFDVWLMDLAHPVLTRFTFDPLLDMYPAWSPDGKQIAFASARTGSPKLFVKAANGAGNEEQLLPGSRTVQLPSQWSGDGRYLLYSENSGTSLDISVVTMSGEHKPGKVVETPANESQGQFSPDGRWVSYTSDESGRYEIYVKSFSGAPARFQVSTAGGIQSRWRGDGKELFYIAPGGKMMAAPVKAAGESFERETPRQLFEVRLPVGFSTNYTYDVTRDGQRFLLVQRADTDNGEPLTLITNWPAALRK